MPVVDPNLPDEAQRKLPHEPWLYMANKWNHPNDPGRNYDFYDSEGETRLDYLLHEDSPLHAENWGDINVFLMARGCLKTTSMIGISTWVFDVYPGASGLMTAPRESQVHEFMEKFKDQVAETGLAQHRTKNRLSKQKFERQYEDADGNAVNAVSYMNTTSAWGDGDASRGYHVQYGVIDEFQDVDEGTFSTFTEGVDQPMSDSPYFPTIFCLGTPKQTGSFFHDLWKMSDQKTWDADKGTWVQQSEPEKYAPPQTCQECGYTPNSFEEVCPRCESDIEFSEDDVYTVKAWHIDQYNSPLHDESRIEMKKQTYSEKKFQNEVLGKFYTPEDDLLSEEDVINCFDEEQGFRDRRRFEDSYVTIGVDWGGGNDEKAAHTVMCVGEHVTTEDGIHETTVLDVEFLDKSMSKDEEIKEIEQAIIKYDADQVVVDEGFGTTKRESLQDGTRTLDDSGYPEVVKGSRFGNVRDPSDLKWESNSGERKFFTVDKSYRIESLVDEFRKQRITIPADSLSFGTENANGTMLIDQLTAPYKEKTETVSGSKKVRIQSDRNDDAIDAFTYMLVAHREVGATNSTASIGGGTRPGY